MATPLYVQVIDDYHQALDERFVSEIDTMTGWWLQVGQGMLRQMQELAETLAAERKAGYRYSISKLYELDRYHQLIQQVHEEILTLTGRMTGLIEAEQTIWANMGTGLARDLRASLSDRVYPGPGQIQASFNLLRPEAVENIVALARRGQPLGDLLSQASPATIDQMSRVLVEATARGRWPRDTAREMMEFGFGAGLQRALLIARDQQIRAYREASRQSYMDFGVLRYARLAAKNVRTCAACLALDGSEWPTEALMPLHPQDRCSMVPIIPGLTPTWESGEHWFARQPVSTQKQILGPGRLAAWQKGQFEFRQLVTVRQHPVWGPTAYVTSLKDLLKGRGGLPGANQRAEAQARVHAVLKPSPHLLSGADIERLRKMDWRDLDKMGLKKAMLDDPETLNARLQEIIHAPPGRMVKTKQSIEAFFGRSIEELQAVKLTTTIKPLLGPDHLRRLQELSWQELDKMGLKRALLDTPEQIEERLREVLDTPPGRMKKTKEAIEAFFGRSVAELQLELAKSAPAKVEPEEIGQQSTARLQERARRLEGDVRAEYRRYLEGKAPFSDALDDMFQELKNIQTELYRRGPEESGLVTRDREAWRRYRQKAEKRIGADRLFDTLYIEGLKMQVIEEYELWLGKEWGAGRVTSKEYRLSSYRDDLIDRRKALRQDLLDQIRIDSENLVTITGDKCDASRKGVEFLEQVLAYPVSGSASLKLSVQPMRAYYSRDEQTIHMSLLADTGTFVHEWGHWLEAQLHRIHGSASKFFRRRTSGENARPLSELTSRTYEDDEWAKKDRFIESYIGKIYSHASTEIVSMGLEMLYDDPARFLLGDPEMFDLILYLLS